MEDVARLGLVLDSTQLRAGGAETVRTLEQIRQAAGQTTGQLSLMEKMFVLLRQGAVAVGVALAGWQFKQIAQQTIELAGRYETLGIVLRKVGESSKYTGSFLANLELQLRKTGISMVASRQVMIQFIQSNLDLGAATKLARVAQDAAVVANLNSSDTLLRLLHGVRSSQTEVLRTIGINVTWEASYRKLASTLKKNVDDLTEQEKVQARVNAVMESAKSITGSYEAAMGTASKQVQSMKRYVEDLQVRLGTLFTPAYTASVFGFAEALKYAANNTDVIATGLAFLVARGLAPAVAWMQRYVAQQYGVVVATLGAAKARVALTAAEVGSIAIQKQTAVYARQMALAELAAAEAANVDAAATIRLTVAKRALAAAEAQLIVVTAAQTAAMTRAAAAQTAAGIASRAAAMGMGALRAVVAFLGGPIGVALTGVAVTMTYLATKQSELKKFSDAHSESLDIQTRYLGAYNAELERRNRLEGRAPTKDAAGEVRKAQQDLDRLSQESRSRAAGLARGRQNVGAADFGTLGEDISPALREARNSIARMNEAFLVGSMKADDYAAALVRIAGQFPALRKEIPVFLQYAANIDVAKLALEQATEAARQARLGLMGVTAAALEAKVPFKDMSETTKEYARNTEQLQAQLAAVRTQGENGLDRVRREQAAVNDANKLWQDYAKTRREAGDNNTILSKSIEEVLVSTDKEAEVAREFIQQARLRAGVEREINRALEERKALLSIQQLELQIQEKQAALQIRPSANPAMSFLTGPISTLRRAATEQERINAEIYERQVRQELAANRELSEAQKDKILSLKLQLYYYEQHGAELKRLNDLQLAYVRGGGPMNPNAVPGGRNTGDYWSAYDPQGGPVPDLLRGTKTGGGGLIQRVEKEAAVTSDLVVEAFKQAARNIQDTFGSMFERIFRDGLGGAKDFGKQLQNLFAQISAQILAAWILKKSGLGGLLDGLLGSAANNSKVRSSVGVPGSTKSRVFGGFGIAAGGFGMGYNAGRSSGGFGGVARGGLSGAAQGAALGSVIPGIGTAIGGVIGGVAGIVGGLFGAGDKKAEAYKQYKKGLKEFLRQIDPDRSELSDAMRALEKTFKKLRNLAHEAGKSAHKARDAFDQAMVDLKKEFVDSLDRQINELSGKGAVNSYLDILKQYDQNTKDLERLGLKSDKAKTLKDMQLEDLFKNLSAADAAELAKMFPELAAAIEKARKSITDNLTFKSGEFGLETGVQESTAQRMSSLLVSLDSWSRVTADNSGLLVALQKQTYELFASQFGGTAGMTGSTLGGAASGGLTVNAEFNITLPAGTTQENAEAIGAAVVRGGVQALDADLGNRLKKRMRFQGNVQVTP